MARDSSSMAAANDPLSSSAWPMQKWRYSLSGRTAEPWESCSQQPQCVTFECSTLDDILVACARLKSLGIEPIATIHDGASTTFYYEDPDHNVVELRLETIDHSQTSIDSRTQLQGRVVDPEKMIAARAAGPSVKEVRQRDSIGEFLPSEFIRS